MVSDGGYFDYHLEKRTLDAFAEFAAGAGHEINNPLAIISGMAQSLLLDESDPSKRRRLASIVEQTRRAYEMIADVRAFARPPQPEKFLLKTNDFFNDWVDRERERCEKHRAPIEIESVSGESNPIVETDGAVLAAILDALGKNAFEATLGGGRIQFFWKTRKFDENNREILDDFSDCNNVDEIECVDSRKEKKTILEIGVEDDGPGLSDEARKLVFSPYFSGRQAGRGLGFGLSKAWRFAEALNVQICCEKSKNFETGCRWFVKIDVAQID